MLHRTILLSERHQSRAASDSIDILSVSAFFIISLCTPSFLKYFVTDSLTYGENKNMKLKDLSTKPHRKLARIHILRYITYRILRSERSPRFFLSSFTDERCSAISSPVTSRFLLTTHLQHYGKNLKRGIQAISNKKVYIPALHHCLYHGLVLHHFWYSCIWSSCVCGILRCWLCHQSRLHQCLKDLRRVHVSCYQSLLINCHGYRSRH